MARILVPFHIDERLDDLDVPAPPDVTVTVDPRAGADPWQTMTELYEQVAKVVAASIERGERHVVFSGDCTTALGTVAGLQRAGLDPAVVWFDGHGDVQTPETTSSGYVGGYPLRLLVGYRPELISRSLGLRPVPEERVTLADARDLDPPEVDYLRTAAIRRVTVPALDPDTLPDGPLYLHLDVDVIDPADLPGLRFPAPGGPTAAVVGDAVRRVLDTGRVVALGVACTWHPGHHAAERLGPVLDGWR